MTEHKKPASQTAVGKAEKGRERVRKADKRAQKAKDILRKKYSVPDKPE